MKIKAAVLREYRAPMKIEELELDEPREKEVQVKMLACGFCHSDLSVWQGAIPQDVPMVPGHEACAVVEKVGPGVTKLQAGRPRHRVLDGALRALLPMPPGAAPPVRYQQGVLPDRRSSRRHVPAKG